MKLVITFILALLSIGSFSQNNNKLIIDFVNEHYSERIGNGICYELVTQAKNYKDSILSIKDSSIAIIEPDSILAGDIICFDNVILSNGTTIKKHTAIIYHISGKLLTIAEQNVGHSNNKTGIVEDSHVKFSIIDISEVISGKITYYRL